MTYSTSPNSPEPRDQKISTMPVRDPKAAATQTPFVNKRVVAGLTMLILVGFVLPIVRLLAVKGLGQDAA